MGTNKEYFLIIQTMAWKKSENSPFIPGKLYLLSNKFLEPYYRTKPNYLKQDHVHRCQITSVCIKQST
jgi:hypothetical protein